MTDNPTPDNPTNSGISLYEAILVDIGDPYAPPTDVLRLSIIGDSASLTIARHNQDNKHSTYTDIADITVDLHTLRQLLQIGYADDQRSKYRPESDPCYRGINRAWTQTIQ